MITKSVTVTIKFGTILTKKDGSTKYYSSYQSAWKAAARLNQQLPTDSQGFWFFESDETCNWYLQYLAL
jgi:hypothetical protein